MGDYSNTYGGAAKDSGKDIILATAIDDQFELIETMSGEKTNVIGSPTVDNIVTMKSDGDIKDSGKLITDKADVAGDTYTGIIDQNDVTASTTGGTGSIHTDGGIGAVKDIVTDATFKPLGNVGSGDVAAVGYSTTDGLKLKGIGSNNDLVLQNDAGATVLKIPTGTQDVVLNGGLDVNGHITTDADGTDDIGTSSIRFRVVYTDSIEVQGGILEGDIADDAVNNDTIAAASIKQAELSSSVQELISTETGNDQTNQETATFVGGMYGLGMRMKKTGTSGWGALGTSILPAVGTASYVSYCQVSATTAGAPDNTVTVEFRYVDSSPPYDMGDGEIGLFIYLSLDTNGKIRGASIAPDPPWMHNGPTNTRADVTIDGKKYKMERDLTSLPPQANKRAFVEAFAAAPLVPVEITMAVKMADMELLPMSLVDKAGRTQILLDPVSRLSHDLLAMHKDESAESIFDILENYVIIDNTPSGRKQPGNVLVPKFRWKP